MSLIPEDANKLDLEGATVPFYKFNENEIVYYLFDSSKTGHPEPMINAMIGLQTIKDDEKLIMINSKAPMGLFPKIEDDFNYEYSEMQDGRFKIIFSNKLNKTNSTNFSDNGCAGSGGGCH